MIGTSAPEYLFIRACIFGLHWIAPLCITYVALIVLTYGPNAALRPFPLLVEIGALLETLFFLCVYLPNRYILQHEATHPPSPSRESRRELFRRCNDNIPDHEAYLRKWFLGAEMSEIRRENMKEFLLWAFFNRGGEPGEDDEELEEYIELTEQHLGSTIKAGRGSAKCLRLTLDPVGMLHRSLIWYLCVGFVDTLTYLKMLGIGFTFYRLPHSKLFSLYPFRFVSLQSRTLTPAKHITYWHRPHTSKTKLPVVFIHGIGIGLYPYTNFLAQLNSRSGLEGDDTDAGEVGILAIELMPVSFRITHPALGKDEACAEINAILKQHGWDKVVLVSHSYGSVVTTWLLKDEVTAPKIGPVVLIDPVSILLHLPDVAYNFTRRKPKRANEHQLWYFASMDMGVSHALGRHFFWNENVLWKEDLLREDGVRRDVTVCLAGRDCITDTASVGQYIGNEELNLTPPATARSSADGDRPSLDLRAKSEGGTNEKNEKDETTRQNLTDELEMEMAMKAGTSAWRYRAWKGKGMDVLWFPTLDHAQVFDKMGTRAPIVNAVRQYCLSGMRS